MANFVTVTYVIKNPINVLVNKKKNPPHLQGLISIEGINNNVDVNCLEMNQSQGMIQIILAPFGEWIYIFMYVCMFVCMCLLFCLGCFKCSQL